MTTTQDPLIRRRQALGELLRTWRVQRRLSVDTAAERAGISPVTYRRLEAGQPARDITYAALEDFLELWAGTFRQALRSDDVVVRLGQVLGVGKPTPLLSQLGNTVQDLIDHLVRVSQRTEVEDMVLNALAVWQVELTTNVNGVRGYA